MESTLNQSGIYRVPPSSLMFCDIKSATRGFQAITTFRKGLALVILGFFSLNYLAAYLHMVEFVQLELFTNMERKFMLSQVFVNATAIAGGAILFMGRHSVSVLLIAASIINASVVDFHFPVSTANLVENYSTILSAVLLVFGLLVFLITSIGKRTNSHP